MAKHFHGASAFDEILALEGQIFREQNGRRTLRFERDGQGYFLKAHFGVGWKEILKNLFQFKAPVLGAENELKAIRRLEAARVETMKIAGFGRRRWNPARAESFLITEELRGMVSLETLCERWPKTPPPFALKVALIRRVANMAKRLHESGVNHRDFYICHFLLDPASVEPPYDESRLRVYLIDLHRAQVRARTPRRWLRKDLAGLLFSSMEIGLGRRDLLRFLKAYRNQALRQILAGEGEFWREVAATASALFRKVHRRPAPLLFTSLLRPVTMKLGKR